MNKIVLILIFCFYSFSLFAQNYKFIYHLDENFGASDEKHAVITGKGMYENNLFRLDCFEKKTGKLFLKAHFTDSALTVMDGLMESYYLNGIKESSGSYASGLEQGVWLRWDSTGMITDSAVYEKGNKIIWAKYEFYKSKFPYSYEITDSLNDTYIYRFYQDNGVKKYEAIFKGSEGNLATYENGTVTNSTVHSRQHSETEFPGGKNAFTQYLFKNLDPLVGADRKAPYGVYRVAVKFTIDTEGNVTDVMLDKPNKKVGYGFDEEALRVIRESPKWIPANLFGNPIKSVRVQPVVFALSGDK